MVVEDHLNLTGAAPWSAPNSSTWPTPTTPGSGPSPWRRPNPPLRRCRARPGVYAQLPGPQFETPAEIRMLRTAGADVVGMSMALETIAARQAGADVLGLALVTNPAAAANATIDVADIADVGAAAVPAVAAIVRHVVGSLA